jgi:hypothetical protein
MTAWTMDPFELQVLKDALERDGKFQVAGETREDYEAFHLVEQALLRLRDRGLVQWIRDAKNSRNHHSTYRKIEVRVMALGHDYLA